METVARKPGIADFKPQVGSAKAPPRKWFGISRTVIIAVVIGAHVVVAGLLAFPVLQQVISEPGPGEEEGPPVAMVDLALSPLAAPPDKTVFPRLKPVEGAAAESPRERARRAGILVAADVRAMLLVRVNATGKPDDVQVTESTGDNRLDEVAVEYARAQEWTPALVAGEAVPMSTRLEVDFPAGS